ncbi:MAG: D-alanine--D-alanine ligase A [Parcubacteria group bacterium ADurb.Bin192]|nr:MAG: D-alanine--D-alanine ligase A [Parcubacteria group bacterium ADurb.Bin192]
MILISFRILLKHYMPNQKIKVGILYGGKSAEHEVSLQSAINILEALNRDKYEPVLICIDKNGQWRLNRGAQLSSDNGIPIALPPQSQGRIFSLSDGSQILTLDAVFPVLHGPFGEDGTVQGLLKLADVPFVGAGVLGSAVGMDKDVMKRLLRDAGLPVGKFMTLKSHEPIPDYQTIVDVLGSPFFIKPANMGSSVGVSKIHDKDAYEHGLSEAFDFDTKIILEENIPGREIECAVLGNEQPLVSIPGEVVPTHDFYSYEAKYLDENGAVLKIPADIPDQVAQRIQKLAIKTFETLSCEGLGRVDFFLKENNEIIVNEINTIPGFTKISMYPKLWEAGGIPYTELIDKLIQLAMDRFQKERKLKTDYTQ